jgi:uroporphyrinogen-III decarboxylase
VQFFGEKFFEADFFTQSIFQARFLKSDIISIPVADFPSIDDIFTEKLVEGKDYALCKNPFGGIHYIRKSPFFCKILHSPVRNNADLDTLPRFEINKYQTKIRDFAELTRKLHNQEYFILAIIKGPFEAPWVFLRGLAPYMMDLARNSPSLTRMIEIAFQPMMELAEMVLDEGAVDGIWVTDDLGETRSPFVSVEKYRRFYKPWHKELVERMHRKGAKVFLHSHGNVMSLVGEFVDVGFDSFDPFDPADNMPLSELKRLYGSRITLTGGITRQIGNMTPEQIGQHLQQIVSTAGPNGLILECGGGIPPEMTIGNYMEYSSAIEKCRRL